MRMADIIYFEAQGIAAKYRGGATLMAAIGTFWLATKATNLSSYRVCKKAQNWRLGRKGDPLETRLIKSL
jgi:hypothetical protein